jgi:hypothetical protein
VRWAAEPRPALPGGGAGDGEVFSAGWAARVGGVHGFSFSVAEAFAFLLLQQVNHDKKELRNVLVVAIGQVWDAFPPSRAATAAQNGRSSLQFDQQKPNMLHYSTPRV